MIKSILFLFLFFQNPAFANLQVFPTRLELSARNRAGHISIRHVGDQAMRYRIRTVFYRMMPSGEMVLVENPKPEERPALDLIRYSPRVVTLENRQEQVVRAMIRRRGKLEPGEYRAHLLFEPIEEILPGRKEGDEGSVNMELKARMAVAVPIIYRFGEAQVETKLSDLKLGKNQGEKYFFEVKMRTEGNAFSHGDFYAYFIPKGNDSERKLVGLVRSVSSYIDERMVRYDLNELAGADLKHGTLLLEYRESSKDEKIAKVLAETRAIIP